MITTTIATVVVSVALSVICTMVVTNIRCNQQLNEVDRLVRDVTRLWGDVFTRLLNQLQKK